MLFVLDDARHRAFASLLCDHLIVTDLRLDAAEEVAREIAAQGGTAIALALDVADAAGFLVRLPKPKMNLVPSTFL